MSMDLLARGLAARAKRSVEAGGLGYIRSAQRIVRAAARGITPITTVMAPPPTYSEGTSGTASTITGANVNASGGGASAHTSDVTRFARTAGSPPRQPPRRACPIAA